MRDLCKGHSLDNTPGAGRQLDFFWGLRDSAESPQGGNDKCHIKGGYWRAH